MLYPAALNAAIKDKMSRGGDGVWYCNDCDYSTKYVTTLRNHIESKHLNSGGFQCPYCSNVCPTNHAMKMHISRKHTYGVVDVLQSI